MRLQFILGEIGIGLRRNVAMAVSVVLVTLVSLFLLGLGFLAQKQVETMKEKRLERFGEDAMKEREKAAAEAADAAAKAAAAAAKAVPDAAYSREDEIEKLRTSGSAPRFPISSAFGA